MRFDQERLEEIFRDAGVAVVRLFGSRTAGRAGPDSDAHAAERGLDG